jgi:hypothetical protein
MPTYYLDFNNNTQQTWTMGVWQTLPESPGLDSVSWKQSAAPKGGSTGVSWEIDYWALVADYKQTSGIGVYKASQKLPTLLGRKWNIVMQDGVQQLEDVGTYTDGHLLLSNVSGQVASPGIGMSGSGSVFKRNIPSNASAQFSVKPKYWAGLFNKLVVGEVISSNVIVGPLEVVYPSGNNLGLLTAFMDGETIRMTLGYGTGLSMSMSEVRARIASLEQMQEEPLGKIVSGNITVTMPNGTVIGSGPGSIDTDQQTAQITSWTVKGAVIYNKPYKLILNSKTYIGVCSCTSNCAGGAAVAEFQNVE